MEGLRPKDPKDGVRKRRLWFSKEDDVEMLRIVVAENPFEHIGRWTYIANVLKSRRGKTFAPKSVRQRVTLLLNNFNVRMMAQRASGKKEGCDKLKQLVQEVSDLKDEAKRCPSEKKRERKRAAMGMALRDKAAMALMDVPVDSKVMPSDELPEELLVNVSQSTMEEESDLNRSSPSTLPNAAYSAHPPAQSTATILPVGTPLLVPPGPERAEKRLRQEMMDQAIWKKLKEEHDLKVEQVAIERLKAENERAKLEIERTMENNSFELRCRQMDLLQENMDQMRRFMSEISELNKHFLTNTIQIMEKIVDKLVQKQN